MITSPLFCRLFCLIKFFSKKANTASEMMAINAVGNAPANIMAPPLVALLPRIMISPNPPAPTKEPMAVIPILEPMHFGCRP